jgi:hypothetical protein
VVTTQYCSFSGLEFLDWAGLVTANVVYQENQSAMLLGKNGKMSSSKHTCHLDVQYFFVTNNIHEKHLWVEYCPTEACSYGSK